MLSPVTFKLIASSLSVSSKRRHWIKIAVTLLLVLVPSVNSKPQSKDRTRPTPLTSNEISGVIDSNSINNSYYYSFTANPGFLSIKITVDAGRRVDNDRMSMNAVSIRLFNSKGVEILNNGVGAFPGEIDKTYIARTNVTERQIMVLSVDIADLKMNSLVGGKYHIRIDGKMELRQSELPTTGDPRTDDIIRNMSKGETNMLECLPKQGTLIIKMKDGSKKIIDLSDAQSVTIVP